MFYKLSNTCSLKEIESDFGRTFKFPNLYEPSSIITGLDESNLSIITSKYSDKIDMSIWGILPVDYDDDWDTFQMYTNTLNTNINELNSNIDIYGNAFDKRRCLIIVNGFFTSKISEGKIITYSVHLKNYKPFCIAGIYNKIKDGFLTCSLLVKNRNETSASISRLQKSMPLIFKKKDYNQWLDSNSNFKNLLQLINNHDEYDFISTPVNMNFYNSKTVDELKVDSDSYYPSMKISRN